MTQFGLVSIETPCSYKVTVLSGELLIMSFLFVQT